MIFSFFFVGWSRDPLSFAQTRIHTSWLKFRCRFIPLVIIVASLFSLKKPPRILTRSFFLFFLLSFFLYHVFTLISFFFSFLYSLPLLYIYLSFKRVALQRDAAIRVRISYPFRFCTERDLQRFSVKKLISRTKKYYVYISVDVLISIYCQYNYNAWKRGQHRYCCTIRWCRFAFPWKIYKIGTEASLRD